MMLAQLLEYRDPYTSGHTRRVTRYAGLLAEKMGLSEEEIELVRVGTPLHDIGKVGIRDEILRKPGRLTPQEFKEMQSHTVIGAECLKTVPGLHPYIPIARHHHERWDGTGYPDRKAGPDIPILARIVAVADAFDAMTSDRPYHPNKKGKSTAAAFEELASQAGRQFDPAAVAAFLGIRDQVQAVKRQEWPDSTVSAIHPALPGNATPPSGLPDPSAGVLTPYPIVNTERSERVLGLQAGQTPRL
jgi:putative nucleotidyltransferase with HDIG domain